MSPRSLRTGFQSRRQRARPGAGEAGPVTHPKPSPRRLQTLRPAVCKGLLRPVRCRQLAAFAGPSLPCFRARRRPAGEAQPPPVRSGRCPARTPPALDSPPLSGGWRARCLRDAVLCADRTPIRAQNCPRQAAKPQTRRASRASGLSRAAPSGGRPVPLGTGHAKRHNEGEA